MSTECPATVISEFVLARVESEAPQVRARLYRSLAQLAIGHEDLARRLNRLAAECDAVQEAHEQLALDFKRRAR